MSALACVDLGIQLEEFAASLRAREEKFVPVLRVAQRLGSKVCLRFEKATVRSYARVDLSASPPTIYVTRRAPVRGERNLESHEDHLLTPRERFSVAHELGHIVAYEKFGLPPAKQKSDYWAQEEWMHRFAGKLLTPDWILDRCLQNLPDGEPLSPFHLHQYANETARLSQEVLAVQLCLRRKDLGFLKVGLRQRKRDKKPVLQVLFAKSGGLVSLPQNYSHVTHPYLLSRLQESEVGSTALVGCLLGEGTPQNLNIAWRCTGVLKPDDHQTSIPVFWMSLATYTHRSDAQLSLWQR